MIKNLQSLPQSIWFKVASALVALFVFYLVAGFLFPVFMGIALAFALNPLVKFFRKIPFRGGQHLPQAVHGKELLVICLLSKTKPSENNLFQTALRV